MEKEDIYEKKDMFTFKLILILQNCTYVKFLSFYNIIYMC